MAHYGFRGFRKYVPVAKRRARALAELARMKNAGLDPAPIEIEGRAITTTFWGGAWCDNLESYSDYANRLTRGRTYVRNGSVMDLRIEAGRVRALVMGSSLYEVEIAIERLAEDRWARVKRGCAGKIGSVVELLRGSLDRNVMEIVTRRDDGLFPAPREIQLECSCPDWADMCKHVAAALYGVGARLDHAPELLFTLRGVDASEMLEAAVATPRASPGTAARTDRVLAADQLSSVFGIEIEGAEKARATAVTKARRPAKKRAEAKKQSKGKPAGARGPARPGARRKRRTPA
jgi:uncharacterized Zn finger protein